jgi:transcriptional regulator with XRE-family HTH domain
MPAERIAGDLGKKLREARERRGVSLREIADRTKIAVSVLEGLERNDISRLPGRIFGRAFVRSFATEIGLDPERRSGVHPPISAGLRHGRPPALETDCRYPGAEAIAGCDDRARLIGWRSIAAAVLYLSMAERGTIPGCRSLRAGIARSSAGQPANTPAPPTGCGATAKPAPPVIATPR